MLRKYELQEKSIPSFRLYRRSLESPTDRGVSAPGSSYQSFEGIGLRTSGQWLEP